jgi:hypothetical protein
VTAVRLLLFVATVLSAAQSAGAEFTLKARQLTFGPKHHFFGYIGHAGNVPWNASGRYIMALETEFQDRMPQAGDRAAIVLLDVEHDYQVRVLDYTRAWNPQQGTMLFWNPESPETQFFFNDRDPQTGKVFCVLFDTSAGAAGKRIREYRFEDTPIGNSGVSQKGGWFAAINYARLARLRAVTGYPEAFDWTHDKPHPANDGVFRVDVRTGEKRLLVSFDQLAEALRPTHSDVDGKSLFINHTLCNREADRIFFFVRADFDNRKQRINQGFVIRPDGTGLTPMKQHIGGHPEWDAGQRLIGASEGRQVIYDVDRQAVVGTLGDKQIFPDPEGDVALSPDGKWLVNGNRSRSRNFYTFFDRDGQTWLRSSGFDVRGWESGSLRCDPAPCWNRNNREIVFPAIAPDGTRQMFLLQIVAGTLRVP